MADSSMPESPGPAVLELHLARARPLRLRDWFVPYGVALALVGGAALAWRGDSRAAALAGYAAYMSLACTFCPLPTTPMVLWAAAPAAGGGLGFHPLLVATLGALATGVANLHDYYGVTALYRLRPVRRVRVTGVYKRMAAWYNRAPFGTLAAASFLPIPVDVVRLLAISEGYSRPRFAVGSVVGRWPRYVLLAYLAEGFDLTWQWILAIGGATVVLGIARGLPVLIRKVRDVARAHRVPVEETP